MYDQLRIREEEDDNSDEDSGCETSFFTNLFKNSNNKNDKVWMDLVKKNF